MFTCMVYLLHIASVSPKNKTASAALSLYSSTQLNSSSEIQCLQHPSQPSYWVSRALTVQITKGPQSRRQFTHCRRHTILYYSKCIQYYFKKTKLYRVEKGVCILVRRQLYDRILQQAGPTYHPHMKKDGQRALLIYLMRQGETLASHSGSVRILELRL